MKFKNLNIHMKPVEVVPEIRFSRKGNRTHSPIIEEFINSNHETVMLDVKWPKGTTRGHVELFISGLRYAIKQMGVPVKVSMRDFGVYLRRTSGIEIPTITVEPKVISSQEELLNLEIEELDINYRTYNCLRYAGYVKVSDFIEMDMVEFLKIKGFGKQSFLDLERALLAVGLSCGMQIVDADAPVDTKVITA